MRRLEDEKVRNGKGRGPEADIGLLTSKRHCAGGMLMLTPVVFQRRYACGTINS